MMYDTLEQDPVFTHLMVKWTKAGNYSSGDFEKTKMQILFSAASAETLPASKAYYMISEADKSSVIETLYKKKKPFNKMKEAGRRRFESLFGLISYRSVACHSIASFSSSDLFSNSAASFADEPSSTKSKPRRAWRSFCRKSKKLEHIFASNGRRDEIHATLGTYQTVFSEFRHSQEKPGTDIIVATANLHHCFASDDTYAAFLTARQNSLRLSKSVCTRSHGSVSSPDTVYSTPATSPKLENICSSKELKFFSGTDFQVQKREAPHLLAHFHSLDQV